MRLQITFVNRFNAYLRPKEKLYVKGNPTFPSQTTPTLNLLEEFEEKKLFSKFRKNVFFDQTEEKSMFVPILVPEKVSKTSDLDSTYL